MEQASAKRRRAVLERVKEYLQHAKECREAAAKASSPGVREHYLHMAETWEVLARQRIAHEHLEGMLTEIGKPDDDKPMQ
jgi:hypothetical protein